MTQTIDPSNGPPQSEGADDESHPLGAWLVFGSAVVWSLGGIIARLAEVENPWTTVFWRAGTATLFLLLFMLLRDGRRGTLALFARMGPAGLTVGLCFAIASTSFVVALQFTTVANVLLMQAGVPLIAALISRATSVEPYYVGKPNPLIELGELKIDKASRRIWRDGETIDLTKREWAIVDLLTQRATAVVSKEQIEEALYDFGSEIESNTVEVHISRLRKKLGRDAIHTLRGVGYRFGAA